MADELAYRQDWDLFVGGREADTLDVLLGSLGMAGKPYERQAQAVTVWLRSPSADTAPPRLRARAQSFVEGAK